MALNDTLRKATIEELKRLNFLFGFERYSRENHETLNLLYNNGILDDNSMDDALEKIISNQAKLDYKMMQNGTGFWKYHADHAIRTDALAYAIEHKFFSEEQMKNLLFDHGDTPESYVKTYGKKELLKNLREELLNPKPLPKIKYHYDIDLEHPTCSCGN